MNPRATSIRSSPSTFWAYSKTSTPPGSRSFSRLTIVHCSTSARAESSCSTRDAPLTCPRDSIPDPSKPSLVSRPWVWRQRGVPHEGPTGMTILERALRGIKSDVRAHLLSVFSVGVAFVCLVLTLLVLINVEHVQKRWESIGHLSV